MFNYYIKMSAQQLFVYENLTYPNEQTVTIENRNGSIYKKYYSSRKFNDRFEIDVLIDDLVIDHNCLLKSSSKDVTIIQDRNHPSTIYYIWPNSLVEKIVCEELDKFNSVEQAQKFSIGNF